MLAFCPTSRARKGPSVGVTDAGDDQAVVAWEGSHPYRVAATFVCRT